MLYSTTTGGGTESSGTVFSFSLATGAENVVISSRLRRKSSWLLCRAWQCRRFCGCGA